ncbi:hypothetical protein [Myroides odoratimimus]|uniref:hypothetical protein n=1 Tax=Myroides odoratimimus TaxID=76832 RepID=UPI000ACAA1FE|nr:hypothetical protein [Myroides odoratimimus]
MAEIKEGILGGVQGKVGTVVGYKYRGKNIIRSLAQKAQRRLARNKLYSEVN